MTQTILERHDNSLESYMDKLRDYQKEADRQMAKNSVGLIAAATGSGKTTMMAASILRERRANPKSKTLVLVHTIDLTKQLADRLAETGLSVGRFYSVEHANFRQDIIVATWQSMKELIKRNGIQPKFFTSIKVDECHHVASPEFQKVVKFFTPKILHGFTATPYGSNEETIISTFGKVVYEIGLFDLIDMGWLSKMKIFIHAADLSKSKYSKAYITKKFAEINKVCAKNGDFHKAIHFFSMHKHHSSITAWNLLPEGSWTEVSSMNGNRKELLEKYKDPNSGLNHLLSVRILNEGIDLPITNTLVFHENVGGFRAFSQRLGRGLRPHEGKQFATVMMFVDKNKMDQIEEVNNFVNEVAKQTEKRTRLNALIVADASTYVEINLLDKTESFIEEYKMILANRRNSKANYVCPKCHKEIHLHPCQIKSGSTFICDECRSIQRKSAASINFHCYTCGKGMHLRPTMLERAKSAIHWNCKECTFNLLHALNYTCPSCGKRIHLSAKMLNISKTSQVLCMDCRPKRSYRKVNR